MLVLASVSCSGSPGGPVVISLDGAPGSAVLRVSGLSAGELSSLRNAGYTDAQWEALLTVSTGQGTGLPAVKGRYLVESDSLTFAPLFPFDRGRDYHVVFDPARLPQPRPAEQVTAVLRLPAAAAPPTQVIAVYPSATEVAENLLRLYIEFSAPMGSSGATDFVKLVDLTDGTGEVVEGAFLPVEADFWSPDHTRYTLFLDPGRVKLDILPNRVSGRPLRAGRKYALDIAAAWPDANRQPLSAAHRHEFSAGPAVDSAILLSDWKIAAPRAGTKDPLMVSFPRALDHAVAMRALSVERRAQRVPGTAAITQNDTRWTFVPDSAWEPGEHHLSAMSFLEDPQGNQINRPFEEAVDAPTPEHQPEAFRLNFVVER